MNTQITIEIDDDSLLAVAKDSSEVWQLLTEAQKPLLDFLAARQIVYQASLVFGGKIPIPQPEETVEDLFGAAQANPAGFGILSSRERFGLGRLDDGLLHPDEMLVISPEQADILRGLGVYYHNFDDDPAPTPKAIDAEDNPFV